MIRAQAGRFLARLLILSMLVGASGAGLGQDDRHAVSPIDDLQDFREVVRSAKAKVFPAVVFIRCVQETHEQGERKSQEVTGSGAIINPAGEVLTNWHVVENGVKVRCLLSDGRAFDAKIVGTDKATDLAVLQLEADGTSNLPFAAFGDSTTLVEGDFVMAMGAPWGLNRSVSIGIVSCTRRYLDEVSEYSLWLQTDAAINPGNSGGPLVNTSGQIVGVNTRGMTIGDGMGFAVPSETIQLLLPQLRDYGRVNWSYTGIQLQPLRDFRRDIYFEGDDGVIVAQTDPESPARHAGLRPRDRILAINNVPVTALTEEDLPSVRRLVAMLPLNEPVTLQVARGEEMLAIELTPREKGTIEGEELDLPRWDFTVKEINQFDNPELYFHRKQGVFIYGIKYPGNAANAGLSTQDILLRIDGKEVATLDDVREMHREAVDNVKSKHRTVLTVLRNGLMRQIVLDFSRDHSKK